MPQHREKRDEKVEQKRTVQCGLGYLRELAKHPVASP
jgi:hypothetical protein